MAHFAQLDNNNIVTQVIVVANEELLLNGSENENKGIIFCKLLFGENTNWKQTSYNNKIRKNYAGIGNSYDPVADVFIAPQPYPSWSLDADHNWQPPTPKPDGMAWYWNEVMQVWVDAN